MAQRQLYDKPGIAHTDVMWTMKRLGWVSAMLAAGVLQAAEGPARCAGDGYAALNFWVGDWTVSDAGGNPIGASKIELGLDGCELTEAWSSGAKFSGRNVHAYSDEDKRWHQINVDNHGHVHAFVGVASARGVEYSGLSKNATGADVLNRMDIVKEGAGRVKVLWRKSADSGKTWTTAYDAIYSRTKNVK